MILCVTGPMASGKNTVCDILSERGFAALDADKVVHNAVEEKRDAVIGAFGEEAREKGINLTDSDGRISRRELARLVFESDINLKKQENIVFPYVEGVIASFIKDNAGRDIALNAVVLYKVPSMKKADAVLFVDAPWWVRLRRVRARDGMGVRDALSRFRAQRDMLSEYEKTGERILKIRNTLGRRALRRRTLRALALLNK